MLAPWAGDQMNGGKRILIIDDEQDHAELVAVLLRRRGYDVEVATDGPTGVERALQLCPDLVLLDLCMPTIDGIATAVNLRGNKTTHEVPIVMMSACVEELLHRGGPISGRFSCLAKPFHAAELLWVVEDALAPRAAEAATGS